MANKKNALVLFTKHPEPGVTKTRLMSEHGGALTAQEAADLYRAMVLDTAMIGLQGLELCRKALPGETFDLYISSSPEETMVKVKQMFDSEFPGKDIKYVIDRGSNFDEHFNDCYQQLFAYDYDSVVCVGGDLPCLSGDLVERSFVSMAQLDADSEVGAMVLAPCQAAGVSLVGVTKDANVDFSGVFYNTEGLSTLDALTNIAREKGLPTKLFEALFDVDFMEDLGHTIAVINAMTHVKDFQPEITVPIRTLAMIEQLNLVTTTPPNTSHDPRTQIDG